MLYIFVKKSHKSAHWTRRYRKRSKDELYRIGPRLPLYFCLFFLKNLFLCFYSLARIIIFSPHVHSCRGSPDFQRWLSCRGPRTVAAGGSHAGLTIRAADPGRCTRPSKPYRGGRASGLPPRARQRHVPPPVGGHRGDTTSLRGPELLPRWGPRSVHGAPPGAGGIISVVLLPQQKKCGSVDCGGRSKNRFGGAPCAWLYERTDRVIATPTRPCGAGGTREQVVPVHAYPIFFSINRHAYPLEWLNSWILGDASRSSFGGIGRI